MKIKVVQSFLDNAPIKYKLVVITICTSVIALLLSYSSFGIYDFVNYHDGMVQGLEQRAYLLGDDNKIYVNLKGDNAIEQAQWATVTALHETEDIMYGAIFDEKDSVFAYYDRQLIERGIAQKVPNQAQGAAALKKETVLSVTNSPSLALNKSSFTPIYTSYRFEASELSALQKFWGYVKIYEQGYIDIWVDLYDDDFASKSKILTVFIRSDLRIPLDRYKSFGSVVAIVFVIGLIGAYLLSIWIQRVISRPIIQLTSTTKKVSAEKDYSIKVDQDYRKDEIGTLASGFNHMLGQIKVQNEALVSAKEQAELSREQAEIAREHAEESAKAKQTFLANMSHEIRTPMNGIMGVADLLGDTKLNALQHKYLDTIRSSASNLLTIINDILDFSKIDSGKLTFEEKDIDIKEVVKSVVDSCQVKIKEKQLKANVLLDDMLPDYIVGDPVRFRQILLNLFSNAVKFTSKGGVVTIGGRLLEETHEYFIIRFYVKDTGIGIEKEKFESIFSIFSQASDDTTRKFGGTGLGLSISRSLVEMQGGKMTLDSEVGKGSTFAFEMSYKKTDPREEPKEDIKVNDVPIETISADSNSGKTQILLAEDNEVNQMVVVTLLEDWGFEVDVAENGQKTLDLMKGKDYSLVLMDVHMPVMDGYNATYAIRNEFEPPKSEVPIMALTANALKGEAEKCFSVGMNDYISKPFKRDVLKEKIVSLLSNTKSVSK
ncbi:response regulator [Flammeovirgaceae bacterium SG7u.111]|nr:response regulator [Flammeovirgaceae bacterium SG7u.132]WPO35274.1 response regulator [Flammeovirgaceae bacterium SG7u.111]